MLDVQLSLNCRGRLLLLDRPVVMGILNVTPDSFYDGGRYAAQDLALRRAGQMLAEGAAILDVGGMSTRPGAEPVTAEEELRRVIPVIGDIVREFPESILSVDTVNAAVAKAAVEAGASLVNDISAGAIDPAMYETVAALRVPYILMHMQGTPQTMHLNPDYEQVVREVLDFLIRELGRLREAGVTDIVIDPGFGFGKNIRHNFELLRNLHVFRIPGLPVLAGVSRKSMIYRTLGTTPEEALNGTSAIHMVALQQGASILRAHDVRPAVEVIKLWEELYKTHQ